MSDPALNRRVSIWLPLALMLSTLVLRVLVQHDIISGLPNFSPLMALAFAGAVVLPRPLPWWVWAILLPVVDLASQGFTLLSGMQGRYEVLAAYLCYAFAAWMGARLRCRAGVFDTLAGTLMCSLVFYFVTNTLSWLSDPAYAKNAAGWIQSLTVGTGAPGLPPTIVFFRNSLLADQAGALLLLMVYNTEALFRSLKTMPMVGFRKAVPATA